MKRLIIVPADPARPVRGGILAVPDYKGVDHAIERVTSQAPARRPPCPN